MHHPTETSDGQGPADRSGALPKRPEPAEEGTEGLPLPNREGSVLGEGREEETDAVGKGPRDPVIDHEHSHNPNAGT